MAAAFQQQIFALDARFNSHRAPNHPNFRTLYIRRRSQLLRENAKFKDIETIQKYLKIRCQLLQRKYNTQDNLSLSSASSRVTPHNRGLSGDLSSLHRSERKNDVSLSENYAFSGVHHIFDQHREQVSVVRFGNNDRSLLCCASHDGCVSVCDVTASPPALTHMLRAHTAPVTGCDWSASNELLVTCSEDATLCLWRVRGAGEGGKCLRRVTDQQGAPLLCCVFQPANNNMVIAGNARGMVEVLNVSTGIYPRGGSSVLGGRVLSLACDSSGRMFWAGNDKGAIVSYGMDPATGSLSKLRRCVVGGAVGCISWSPWIDRRPALLVNTTDNSLYLFRVCDGEGGLQVRRRIANAHSQPGARSTFCPIMSFRRGTCVVTASEDSCLYFLDVDSQEARPVINKLQGHASPVLGVSFSYDESLLASSDLQGLVIIWRRS